MINLSLSSDNVLIFSYEHQQVLIIAVIILHHLQTPWLKKLHFTKYTEISERKIRMFTLIHLNFEWKHSNLRLSLYLFWFKIIHKYKMLWPLIQVNLTLMFYINEIPISSHSTKKRLFEFFTVTLRSLIKYDSLFLFSVTQHHEKRWDPPTYYAWRNYWIAPSKVLSCRNLAKLSNTQLDHLIQVLVVLTKYTILIKAVLNTY